MIRPLASPAKINLFLHVTGKRADGFHELCSLMTKIDLADDMSFDFHGKDIRVSCDHPAVPDDHTNLAHRAAVLFLEASRDKGVSIPFKGVDIRIRKRIPVGGGLGGGSSNAAAVLSALNRRAGSLFSQKELMGLGLRLGADVPFFIFGGPALARGVGEVLTRLPDLPPYWLVLCNPGVAASTPKVFKELGFCLTSPPEYTIRSDSNVLLKEGWGDIREQLHNDLEDPACRLYPEINSTKKEMELLLKRSVHMSGSGSSLFALYSGEKRAKRAFETLCRHWGQRPEAVCLTALQNG